ncbi:MAG: hypothetical protein Unbinned7794contig1000_1 [Prokaryotic dsDNA virus sp.]|nr:MAG: hypothetical protein Unbinned7794contig1000_1 [Prokaryotic dsDNA virus sp.]|tara:strand:+ start:15940 stop:18561 length:2622 start_codon:yes stop_codon:yes gene_type:complete
MAEIEGVSLSDDELDSIKSRVESLSPVGTVRDRTQLGASLYQAARTNPDEQAKINQLADSQQLPPDTVGRNMPEVEARDKYGYLDPDEIWNKSPIVANFVKDPARAAESIDDLARLRAIEKNLKPAPDWNAMRKMGQRINTVVGNSFEWMGTQAEQEWQDSHIMENWGLTGLKINGVDFDWSDLPEDTPNPLKIVGRYMSEGTSQSFGYVPTYTVDRLFDNPTLENTVGFMMENGPSSVVDMAFISSVPYLYYMSRNQEFAEDRAVNNNRSKDDVTPEDLLHMAIPTLAVAALEKIGVLAVFNMTKVLGVKGVLKATGLGALGETLTEAVQEPVEYLSTSVGTLKPPTVEGVVKSSVGGALGGLGTGGTIRGVTATGQAIVSAQENKLRTEAETLIGQVQLAEFLALSQQSSTRERAQDRFKEFLSVTGKDRSISVPAAEINKLIEQGVELPQYIVDQANDVDSDVEIPVDRFISEIAFDETLMGTLRPHIKFTSDTMTGAEFEAVRNSTLQKLMTGHAAATETTLQIENIYESVKDQLVATGRYSEETAKYQAMIFKSLVETRSQLYGLSPDEIFERLNFKIKGPDFDPNADTATLLQKAQQSGYPGTDMNDAIEWVRAVNDNLDMTPDGRNDRANEMGFVTDAFHGTLFSGQDLVDDSRNGILEFDKKTGDIGYHFGATTEQANNRIKAKLAEDQDRIVEKDENPDDNGLGNILPIRLKLKNPIRLTDAGEWRNSVGVAQTLIDSGQFSEQVMAQMIEIEAEARALESSFDTEDGFMDSQENDELNDELLGFMLDAGYDGVVYGNQVEGSGESYIVFDPSQVRSTNAAFHPMYEESANILSQDGESEITIERRQLDKRIGVIENLVRCMGS